MGELLFQDEVFQIQGAIFEVRRTLGVGFLEAVYQECLALEFARRGIPFQATPKLSLAYKGVTLAQTYSPDFVCFDAIVVELKAVRDLAPEHRAQVLNYLCHRPGTRSACELWVASSHGAEAGAVRFEPRTNANERERICVADRPKGPLL